MAKDSRVKRGSEALESLRAHDFGNAIAREHAQVKVEDLLRPQQAISIVHDAEKRLVIQGV
jgi:hemin uptake protein HemP